MAQRRDELQDAVERERIEQQEQRQAARSAPATCCRANPARSSCRWRRGRSCPCDPHRAGSSPSGARSSRSRAIPVPACDRPSHRSIGHFYGNFILAHVPAPVRREGHAPRQKNQLPAGAARPRVRGVTGVNSAYVPRRERDDGSSGRRRLAGRAARGAHPGRALRAADHALPQLGHRGRQRRPERRRRLPGGARALPPLRRALVSVGAPHRDLPDAQGARGRGVDVGGRAALWVARLDLRQHAGRDARHRQRHERARRGLSPRRPEVHRPRHRAGAVGQGAAHDREQRIGRDHPDAQLGVRPLHQRDHRLLSGGAARGDRRASTR